MGLSAGCRVVFRSLRSLSFLDWLRRYKQEPNGLRRHTHECMLAIGVRFVFELMDLFIGQYAAMFIPHYVQGCFECTGDNIMEYTSFFVGTMSYLQELRWGGLVDGIVTVQHGAGYLSEKAFPSPLPSGDPVLGRITGTLVFSRGDEERVFAGMAFSYLARVLEQEVSALTQCASCQNLRKVASEKSRGGLSNPSPADTDQ